MLSALSPILVFADRVLDSIETRVVAPLAARLYQLAPHCSGCGGPVPHDALDCEGCRTLDAFELRSAKRWACPNPPEVEIPLHAGPTPHPIWRIIAEREAWENEQAAAVPEDVDDVGQA